MGDEVLKLVQYKAACDRICAGISDRPKRRMCVARDLKTMMGADEHRGIMELVHRDTWPDDRAAGSALFAKGKSDPIGKLEDARDGGILYPMVCEHPPSARGEIY